MKSLNNKNLNEGREETVLNENHASIKAKKKLKRHLELYTHDDSFIVTEKRAAYWWGVINRAAFSNKLPKPLNLETKIIHKAWGYCTSRPEYDNVDIRINSSIDSRELFLATIAHEMVHQWQFLNEGRMSHAKSYLKWKRYFKRHFNITL